MSGTEIVRRRQVAVVIASALLLLLTAPSLLFAGGSDEGVDTQPQAITEGRVDYFEGEVTVNGEPAQLGLRVETGDTVVTGEDSLAEVVFGEKNIFRLDENTFVRLTFEETRQGARLERGTFAAVFDELVTAGSGEEDGFVLETNTAVAAVRGTTFFVKEEGPDATFICTCHGSLRMDPLDGPSPFTVTNYRHEAYRFRRDGDQVVVEPMRDLYHSSEDLNRLADRIDVTIPWGEAPRR
jgi:hypothetical protein